MRDRDIRERVAALEAQVRCLALANARTHRDLRDLRHDAWTFHNTVLRLLGVTPGAPRRPNRVDSVAQDAPRRQPPRGPISP